MSLHYKFHSAVRLLDRLPREDRPALRQICRRIRDAEARLQTNAAPAMQRCLYHCGGLCCRNTQVDAIISQLDLVYILADDPARRYAIAAQVAAEAPFFTADCMFLKDRTGPCIFPPDARPEVCITTFCSGSEVIRKELRHVRRQFRRLQLFICLRHFRAIRRWVADRAAGRRRSRPML